MNEGRVGLSVPEMLTETLHLLRLNYLSLLLCSGTAIGAFSLVGGLHLQLLVGDAYPEWLSLQAQPLELMKSLMHSSYSPAREVAWALALLSLIQVLVVVPLVAAVLSLQVDALEHGGRGVRGSWRAFFPMLGSYVGLVTLKSLAVWAGYIVFFFPGVFLSMLLSQAELRMLLRGEAPLQALQGSFSSMEEPSALWRFAGLWSLLFLVGILGVWGISTVLGSGLGMNRSVFGGVLVDGMTEILLLPINVVARVVFFRDLEARDAARRLDSAAVTLSRDAQWTREEGDE